MAITIFAVLWVLNLIALAGMGQEKLAHVVLVGIAIESYYMLRVREREWRCAEGLLPKTAP
jgi:hypothetical protein